METALARADFFIVFFIEINRMEIESITPGSPKEQRIGHPVEESQVPSFDKQVLLYLEFAYDSFTKIGELEKLKPSLKGDNFKPIVDIIDKMIAKKNTVLKFNYTSVEDYIKGWIENHGYQPVLQSPTKTLQVNANNNQQTPKRKRGKKQKVNPVDILVGFEAKYNSEQEYCPSLDTIYFLPVMNSCDDVSREIKNAAKLFEQSKNARNWEAYRLGQLLKYVKENRKHFGIRMEFHVWVQKKCDLDYDKSWMNKLIRFYEFTSVYKKLLQCAVSITDVVENKKELEEYLQAQPEVAAKWKTL